MSRYERKEKSQRKHPPSVSGAPKGPSTLPSSRPGWKGPGFVKKATRPQVSPTPSSSSSTPKSELQPQLLPQDLQQLILNIFRDTFPASKDFETLKPVLQEIKDALFQRDFERAFGNEEYLEAYAVRWSPSRVLGYANVLAWICNDVGRELEWVRRLTGGEFEDSGSSESSRRAPMKIIAVGGGAAELVACAALLRYLHPDSAGKPLPTPSGMEEENLNALHDLTISESSAAALIDLQLIDLANWTGVISKLHTGLMTPPILSKYASTAAKASNASFMQPNTLSSHFTKADVLGTTTSIPSATETNKPRFNIRIMIPSDPVLITLLFTLNELYSASIPKTTAFLLEVTAAAPRDSLLLVIDSPGSYSETIIGTSKSEDGEDLPEKKKHPMHWLLDYALLGKFNSPRKVGGKEKEQEMMWEKVIGEESRWFRLLDGLKYPVSLENMRFQIHLFRRL